MAVMKEVNYFDMFVTSVEFNCRIAGEFLNFVENYSNIADKEKAVQDLHIIEHEADIHFHTLYKALMKSFITPIEREDILLLAQSIDDISDTIEDVAYSIYCLNIDKLNSEVKEFARLIVKSCNELKVAVTEFKKFKKSKILSEKINEVNFVEEDGDKLYHKAVRELFYNPPSTLEVIKWREIYDKLEVCLDACENVADILDGIVLKNS